MSKKYYHGSPVKFDNFDASFCTSGSGGEQYGSGFYFTNSRDEASRYAGYDGFIYEVELKTDNLMTVPKHNEKKDNINPPLTNKQIKKMIQNAPEHEETLLNFGDIDYYGYDEVLQKAIGAYAELNPLYAINTLGSDFYDGNEEIVVKKIKDIIGIDGIFVNKKDGLKNIVMLDGDDIEIISVEKNIKNENMIKSELEEGNNVLNSFGMHP